jgi:anti-sigma factor RsiW
MLHSESLRIHAYFDHELDAVSAVEVEQHLAQCSSCRALLQDIKRTRESLQRELSEWHAPPRLRREMLRRLSQENTKDSPRSIGRERWLGSVPPFWRGSLSGAVLSAIAAVLAIAIWVPSLGEATVEELMNAHMRSLMPTHLIDVVSTDKHTVKPWFSGHTDVSPAVADFEVRGYRLIGGRADYVAHQRAAAVVYQHGAHIINVFSWSGPQRGLPTRTTRNGYHLLFWKSGDLEYCAISDTDPTELLDLSHLMQGINAADARE